MLFINTTAEVTKYKKLYIKFKYSSTVLVKTQIPHKAGNKTKTGRGQKNMVDVAEKKNGSEMLIKTRARQWWAGGFKP